MRETLMKINTLLGEKIIDRYAIGGSIAALFYIEPTVTYDLDILVILHCEAQTLEPLKDIYAWAHRNSYEIKAEHIIIEGIPVQFLPVYKPLIEEAVERANEKTFDGVKTFVVGPEFLIAIMMDVNRPIDRERALRFFKTYKELDVTLLENIIDKFQLNKNYNSFKEKFVNEG